MDAVSFPQPLTMLPCAVMATIAHTASGHVFQSIVIMVLHTKFNIPADEIKDITRIYDSMGYAFLVIGATLIETNSSQFVLILSLIFASAATQLLFHTSTLTFLVKLAIYILAAVMSTVKIGIIGYGATDLEVENCLDVQSYFLITYIAVTIGHLVGLCFVSLDMILYNSCGRLTCFNYVMYISILLEIIAGLAFIGCSSIRSKDTERTKYMDTSKSYRTFILFIPFIVIWICHDSYYLEIIYPLPKIMDCQMFWYYFAPEHILAINMIINIICLLIYYVVLTYIKWVLIRPIWTIVFGGCLMVAGIIALAFLNKNFIKYEDELSYPPAIHSNFYFITNCLNTKFKKTGFTWNSQSYNLTDSLEDFYQKVWNIGGKNYCGVASVTSVDVKRRVRGLRKTICIREREFYIFNIKCVYEYKTTAKINYLEPYDLTVHHFDMLRASMGRARLCFVSPEGNLLLKNYHVKLLPLKGTDQRYVFMYNDNFTCRNIQEGSYNIMINYERRNGTILFQRGGVYFMTANDTKYSTTNILQPTTITIWYLIGVLALIELGKTIIITTAFYVAYIQSHENIRITTYGALWLYTSSETVVSYLIKDHINYRQWLKNHLLYSTILVAGMIVMFLLISLFFRIHPVCDFKRKEKIISEEDKEKPEKSLSDRPVVEVTIKRHPGEKKPPTVILGKPISPVEQSTTSLETHTSGLSQNNEQFSTASTISLAPHTFISQIKEPLPTPSTTSLALHTASLSQSNDPLPTSSTASSETRTLVLSQDKEQLPTSSTTSTPSKLKSPQQSKPSIISEPTTTIIRASEYTGDDGPSKFIPRSERPVVTVTIPRLPQFPRLRAKKSGVHPVKVIIKKK